MDPGGYWLGALNPNEALNCVDDINRVVLQVIMRASCPMRVYACRFEGDPCERLAQQGFISKRREYDFPT